MRLRFFYIIKVLLSLIFISSGLLKGIDPYGTSLKLNEYFNQFEIGFLKDSSLIVSVCLCSAEIFLGFCMLFNTYLNQVLYVAVLMLLIFTLLLILIIIIPGASIADCGCFGDFIQMSLPISIVKNVLLIGFISVLLYMLKVEDVKFLKCNNSGIAIAIVLISASIPIYSAKALPLFELSEYKIGANLRNVKSFQVVNSEYDNVTEYLLNSECHIIIIQKKEFSEKELEIINNIRRHNLNMKCNIDIITGLNSKYNNEVLYSSDSMLKMIVRTPNNSLIYLKNGHIKYKVILGNIPITLKH